MEEVLVVVGKGDSRGAVLPWRMEEGWWGAYICTARGVLC